MACVANGVGTVSEKLMHKMSVQAPPKITIEKYMIEIAKYYNVEYEPDPQVERAFVKLKNLFSIISTTLPLLGLRFRFKSFKSLILLKLGFARRRNIRS